MTVTFLRMRPAESLAEPTAVSRRREGTTAIELEHPTSADLTAASKAGVLVAATRIGEHEPAAWVLPPEEALRLGPAGWRLTVLDEGSREHVLDALARTGARYVRTARSNVATVAQLASLPGLDASVSVFVDDIDQAVQAVGDGAGDLLLRDWSQERIGELRDTLDLALVERSVFPIGLEIDEARDVLPAEIFTAWLSQVDGSGAVRPRYEWAPGKDMSPPVPAGRISAEWTDSVWVDGTAPDGIEGAGELAPILERSLSGTPPTTAEIEMLFRARGDQVDAIAHVADVLRKRAVGDTVTYVVNRNINYTNLCYFKCGFCAFSKGPKSLNLRGDPYLMGLDEIVGLAREAWDRGATEVTLQGGIHPDFTGNFYREVVEAIKAEMPDMHIHGFTPLEVWQGAETLGISVRQFLTELRDAGLGTLPGTAAEILDDQIRAHLCPDKIRTSQWAEVMITAHELGLRATATIMFGHIDHPRSWANHLEVIRQIQRRTGGFTEMVPLPFVHMGSPIFLRGRARPGPTWDEAVLIHSVSRIAFDGLIDNIQASWVKLGLDGGARLLDAGCNDLGGTLMGEIITRSAGAEHGQEVSPAEFVEAIRSVGRTPAVRNTTYEVMDTAAQPR
ncbi:MAG TPA: 5-amino-6-(D-ribitylamino)uracil--L-tyrosine 4-hydroxyphenyl transferase CofH [Acidimicrobiia bacterium]|jgi:FO synthase|nr:5-amino-6-(D-ribitylamino)uracil--L-tyrosine 4-hydroxyphenyl transferase CofH [Acidimicrobiia bacterium]